MCFWYCQHIMITRSSYEKDRNSNFVGERKKFVLVSNHLIEILFHKILYFMHKSKPMEKYYVANKIIP